MPTSQPFRALTPDDIEDEQVKNASFSAKDVSDAVFKPPGSDVSPEPGARRARGTVPAATLAGVGVSARDVDAASAEAPKRPTSPVLEIVPDPEPSSPYHETVIVLDDVARRRASQTLPAQEGNTVIEPPAGPTITPDAPAEDAKPEGKYAEYSELGLPPPKPRQNIFAKLAVSTYRLLGFAILSLIVFILVGYITTSIFFYVNKSWIAPAALAPSDVSVANARTALHGAQDQRDRTAAELEASERAIEAHQAFQTEFVSAVKGDAATRKQSLARLRDLATTAQQVRSQIRDTSNEFAASSGDKMSKEYEAGLIDRQSMLTGKFTLAQISGVNLTVAERQAQYEQQAEELEQQARALDAIVNGKSGATLSYEVLKIKREFDASRLDLAKAMADQKLLAASLARQDQTIADLQASPYLRAAASETTVAYVPYRNLEGVEPGVAVYACKFSFVNCEQVGKVREVLVGEVTFRHPRRDMVIRGQMVELELAERYAAKHDYLFFGKKPLGF